MQCELEPECRIIILGLIRREKQRILGKPVDKVTVGPEEHLLALDVIAQKIVDSLPELKLP